MLELDKIYNVNCLEGMKQIDNSSFEYSIFGDASGRSKIDDFTQSKLEVT